MNTSNIKINTQSSIRIEFDKILYFDPFKIELNDNDADIIFITHEHYDHFDIESINKIKNDNTIVVAPKSMKELIDKIGFKDYIYLDPNEETNILGIDVKTIPAYNIGKSFHPKENKWVGYVISYNDTTYYIAGDTDMTPENECVKCDIALIPIGGHYTMDYNEGAQLVKKINPKVVIPTHYGSIVGSKNDGKLLKELLSDTGLEVIQKINF